MSFLTERYFQILESHNVYKRVCSDVALRFFLERHVICVWSYNAFLKSIYKDLSGRLLPINSNLHKEALKILSEIILEEEVVDLGNGKLLSHLELYLEAMMDVGCDMDSVFSFFDLIEMKIDPYVAAVKSGFVKEVCAYVRDVSRLLEQGIHERATALFYEGEPYIPDNFLVMLYNLRHTFKAESFLTYLNVHVEGLKAPGFSAAGRLVDIFCEFDDQFSEQAEKAAKLIMKARIKLWDAMDFQLADNFGLDACAVFPHRRHLRVVK